MQKHILFILVLFIITGQVIWAQNEGTPFSLIEAQNHAIQNNPERLNALLDIEIADKKVWETTAMGLPQLSGGVDVNVILSPLPTLSFPGPTGEPMDIAVGEKANATLSATVSQLVFSGPYIVGLQASKAYRKMSENALTKTDRDIESNVASSYYTVLLLTETTTILDSSITNLTKTLEDTRAMAKVGFVDEVVADQLNVTLSMVINSSEETKRQHKSATNLLKFQMGINIDSLIILTDKLEQLMQLVSSNIFNSLEYDLTNNIDLQIMANQIEISELQLKLEKSNFLPNLGAFATFQRLAKEPEINFTPTSIAGLSLSVPIFSSGMRRSKVQQAKLSLQKSRNSFEQVKQGLTMELSNAISQYTTAWEKYSNEKENKALALKVYENYRVKFAKGMASQQDVIQANDKHLQAVGNYMGSMVELFNAKINVDKIIGTKR